MRWVLTWKSSGAARAGLVVLGFQAENLTEANNEQDHEVRAAHSDGEPWLHGEGRRCDGCLFAGRRESGEPGSSGQTAT